MNSTRCQTVSLISIQVYMCLQLKKKECSLTRNYVHICRHYHSPLYDMIGSMIQLSEQKNSRAQTHFHNRPQETDQDVFVLSFFFILQSLDCVVHDLCEIKRTLAGVNHTRIHANLAEDQEKKTISNQNKKGWSLYFGAIPGIIFFLLFYPCDESYFNFGLKSIKDKITICYFWFS